MTATDPYNLGILILAAIGYGIYKIIHDDKKYGKHDYKKIIWRR